MTKNCIKDWSQADVLNIRQWRRDSLKNSALIGTGVGFGLSLAAVIAYCRSEYGCGGEVVAGVAVYTGIGAAIGVGIDALIPNKQTVYVGGTRISLNGIKVKPVLGNSRKGVAVAFSF